MSRFITYGKQAESWFSRNFPHTSGRVKRWYADKVQPRMNKMKNKVELPNASHNFKRDFQQAATREREQYKQAKLQADMAQQRLDARNAEQVKTQTVQQNTTDSNKRSFAKQSNSNNSVQHSTSVTKSRAR